MSTGNSFSVWVNHTVEAEEVDFFTALTTAFKAFQRGDTVINVYANGPKEDREASDRIQEALFDAHMAKKEERDYYKEGRM